MDNFVIISMLDDKHLSRTLQLEMMKHFFELCFHKLKLL